MSSQNLTEVYSVRSIPKKVFLGWHCLVEQKYWIVHLQSGWYFLIMIDSVVGGFLLNVYTFFFMLGRVAILESKTKHF